MIEWWNIMSNRNDNRSERNRIRRKRRRAKRNKRNILLLTIIMCIISTTILFNGFELKKKNLAYAAQESELQLRLEEESERTEEINELGKYVQTDEYVEEVAHDKLGLAYPDEIIFQQAQ